MLVNQRAECRFSIHFVVFFCLVCMLFRVFTGFVFVQYFILFVMGTGVFQRELKFLHSMFRSDILASVRGLFSRDVG